MVFSLSRNIEGSNEFASSCACPKHKNINHWRLYHTSFLFCVADLVHTNPHLQTQMTTLFSMSSNSESLIIASSKPYDKTLTFPFSDVSYQILLGQG